jgi:hypothetical protein
VIDWDQVNTDAMSAFAEDAGGGLVSYTPRGAAAFDLALAVFDDAVRQLVALDDVTSRVTTTDPKLGVLLSGFPAGVVPAQGDRLTVRRTGQTFIVNNVGPDSHGWALLELNLVKAAGMLDFTQPANADLAGT